MKIIFLNTWHGKTGSAFLNFIREHANNTDVFCLMEADTRVISAFQAILPEYEVISKHKAYLQFRCSQATFFSSKVELLSHKFLFPRRTDTGLGLYTKFRFGDKEFHVFNFHGASTPVNKLDDPIRLEASQKIIELMNSKSGLKIIGGDFNLLPETESVRMFEKNGYKNLVTEYKIPTTRNHFAWDKYPDKQLFADYCFVSPELRVKSFIVPQNEVSDHLPLILEVEI